MAPRLLRSNLPDGIYHVTTRGVADTFVYREDDDRWDFARLLGLVVVRFDWELYALCLMGTHYHGIVATTQVLLSSGMQRLNGIYAQGFNEKYGRAGHLWGGRFVSRVIEDEAYLREACAYVVRNPVRAGLCDEATEWPWSYSRYGLAETAEGY
jgi:putative transposase